MSSGLIRDKISGHTNKAAQKIIPKVLLLRLRKLIKFAKLNLLMSIMS